jgi:hypothetical protein
LRYEKEARELGIHEYLLNPHKIGVFYCSFDIEAKNIIKLLEEAVDFSKKENITQETYDTLRFRDHTLDEGYPWLVEDFKKVLDHLDIFKPGKPPLGPWQLKKPFREVLTETELRHMPILEDNYRRMMSRYPNPSRFLDRYQAAIDKENAISLDFTTFNDVLRLNLCSLKQQGIETHKEFLQSIPLVGRQVISAKTTQKFSSRYCYRIYPSALMVWLCEVADNPIPKDILQFILGAIRYYEQGEWRISIVLSAIAVETILAELYEENKHRPAPPDTLGTLLSIVSKTVEFPDEIRADAEEVNRNRISSVHRSSMDLGDREARSALVGVTRFTHWTYFHGPFSN